MVSIYKNLVKVTDTTYCSRECTLKRSGLKAPAKPSCQVPTYIVFFFSNSSSVEIFHKYFYLISLNRLKSISEPIIIIVNNNNFDFIAILLLTGGLKATAE